VLRWDCGIPVGAALSINMGIFTMGIIMLLTTTTGCEEGG